MKQNGAVAAYQIIQIHPPTSHPDLIQLSRAKSSGTILWKRNTKEGKEEVKQTENDKKIKSWKQGVIGILTACANERLRDRCADNKREPKDNQKDTVIPRYCIKK